MYAQLPDLPRLCCLRQVIKNVDELFEREELSAAPDAGWPDCFNSGVFVFRPSLDTYKSLLQFAVDFGSFDGRWHHLFTPRWRWKVFGEGCIEYDSRIVYIVPISKFTVCVIHSRMTALVNA